MIIEVKEQQKRENIKAGEERERQAPREVKKEEVKLSEELTRN